MAKNNNTKPVSQAVKTVSNEPKKLDATRIFLIVFAAVALVGILASIIVAVVVDLKKKTLDYMNANLSAYVTVAESLYNNYEVKVDVPEVTDFDVENKILGLLCENKDEPTGPVNNDPKFSEKLSAGDVTNIFYRGYTLDENNNKNYFDGGCNFNSSIYSLELGSGSFIPGFEYNLVGKIPTEYAKLEKLTTGMYAVGDIIQLTYTVSYADGTAAVGKTALIDLSDPDLDKTWGEGFSAYFNNFDNTKSHTIGKKFATGSSGDDKLKVGTIKNVEGAAEKDTYMDLTITEAYRISAGNKLEVEAYFPYDYANSEELAGKTATFEVYIMSVQDFDVPALDEKFITETLKIKAEDLAGYDGDDIVAQYKNSIKAELVEEYNENVKSFIEEKFWAAVMDGAKFKKLPKSDVEEAYNEFLLDITLSYESGYSSYYSSLDAFARAYLGLSGSADWKNQLYKNAESAIKQKLIFYYIIREENLIPSDAEYNEIYERIFNEHVDSYLAKQQITEESENYAEKKTEAEAAVREYYIEEYWKENVLYEYFVDEIVSRASKK